MDIPAGRLVRGSARPLRLIGLLLVVVAIIVVAALISGGSSSTPAIGPDGRPDTGPLADRRDPLLPDLAMGPIEDVALETMLDSGDQRLRFAATIVNLGDGPFVVRAQRSFPFTDDWILSQLVVEAEGGYTERGTGATLVFGGDGHEHWHVKQVEEHRLETLDGEVLGTLLKQGFCFFDTDLYRAQPGSPDKPHWGARGCAKDFDTSVRMGLSVGWGDKYPWHLLDERIPVSLVPDGRYVIRQIADPFNEFEELDETNNETWVEIELGIGADGYRQAVVVAEGPHP